MKERPFETRTVKSTSVPLPRVPGRVKGFRENLSRNLSSPTDSRTSTTPSSWKTLGTLIIRIESRCLVVVRLPSSTLRSRSDDIQKSSPRHGDTKVKGVDILSLSGTRHPTEGRDSKIVKCLDVVDLEQLYTKREPLGFSYLFLTRSSIKFLGPPCKQVPTSLFLLLF